MENTNIGEVFSGLEEYIKFKNNNQDQISFLRDFVRILYSNDIEQSIIEYCIKHLNEDNNYKDNLFRSIVDFKKKIGNDIVMINVLSKSQVRSKIWLIEELEKIKSDYNNVLIMAGWFGQLSALFDLRIGYDKIRIVELDKNACEVSDQIFNSHRIENYRVKSITADINELILYKNGYEWDVENFKDNSKYSEKFLPDLIINTSAEHMTEEWYNQIRFKQLESDPIVAIQSNNLFDIPEHNNSVHSVDHMKEKFPMREILFEGELQLKGYKRFMLIGRI